MSNPNPSNVRFSSRYEYFLNYDTEEATVTIPAVSVPAGSTTSGTLTIPVTDKQNFSQIKVNYSTSPSNWYVFPTDDVTLNASFKIAAVGAYTGSGFTMTFYVANTTAGAVVSPAVMITARARLFETPN